MEYTQESGLHPRPNGSTYKTLDTLEVILSSDRDTRALAKHGKRQQLNVRLIPGHTIVLTDS